MIKIEISDQRVNQALSRLAASTQNLRPALQDIGELLVDSTKRRFGTSTGPDGQRWAPNSQVTILRYLGLNKGSFSKRGGLTKNGAARSAGKKPLIGDSGDLSRQIYPVLEGSNTLLIGSSPIYAAVQQFGAKKQAFGQAPWGDIPARPFLGVSDQDRTDILDTISDYLGKSFRP
jgi:phage gpG-like protein